MKSAQYSLIRYLADPARGEPLNVGIVAWDGSDFELALDHQALARVIRDNPKLHRDSLFALESMLQDRLEQNRRDERPISEFIENQRGYPVLFSEPRHTTVMGAKTGLNEAVERLLMRSVRPGRRGGGGGIDIADLAERGLKEAVAAHHVDRDYMFQRSRTGVPRRVDYFANSGRQIALDIIKLNLKRADEIRLRADAEAYKIYDIGSENQVSAFVVLTEFSPDPELASANDGARRIMRSAGANVVVETDANSAIGRLDEEPHTSRKE